MNQIKVGGVIYSIENVGVVEIDGNRNYQGVCVYDRTLIKLLDDDSVSEERRKETLIHELVHAIGHEANIEMSEESVVQFSKVLCQVLQDNDFGWLKRDVETVDIFTDGHSIIKMPVKV